MSDSSHLPSPGVQSYWDSKATPRFSLLDHLSTRGSAQELATARGAIDDELSALDAIMRRMRTRRNDFSPISRLPPELLAIVFTLHAINHPPLGQLALGWITVTHVSRHWRQVALSNPKLWVNIVFDLGAEWAEEMLERSKAAPIS
ncbi:hypothetical protein BC827DRAFT_1362793, partial [Russula dissimulans]